MKCGSLLLVALPLAHATAGRSVQIPLDDHYNNKAFGSYPGEAALDILNSSFPADRIANADGIWSSKYTGIDYLFPGYNPNPTAGDNVICSGQTIQVLPSEDYFSASLLLVSDVRSTTVSGNVTLHYTDNSTSVAEVRAYAFWWFLVARRGEITYPYYFTHNNTNHNASDIYERYVPIEQGKTLSSITLPETTNGTSGRLHIFSLSLWQGDSSGIEVQGLRPTQNFDDSGKQLVEVTLNHVGNKCISGMRVSVDSVGAHTTEPALVKRVCPGDQKRVQVPIDGESDGEATVSLNVRCHRPVDKIFPNVQLGLKEWQPTAASMLEHESPTWFNNAKFGIFIHWGVYSVPGWGNSTPTECYAEWFWWYSTRLDEHAPADRCGFSNYRLRTFGPDLNYDDFFENFTASAYDPKSWVDLFADAGAQYFVFTTKHHDGFATFDTEHTTNRSSLNYGPRRDLLGELFDAAEMYQPHLKRGTYFSLPEWFNPDYGKYGFTQYDRVTSTSHPGIIARNPYTGEDEPYTGRIPVEDFIDDLMVPQMEILAYKYNTDIMWCDAGAFNGTDAFAADWFNSAAEQGRQVAINDRCGSPWAADYDTPEYQTFSVAQQRKWESNQGMDPYSYGYNRETPYEEYMNASTLIHNLIDMSSKNGNLLLNIGPREDGSIHEAMVDHLREAGAWIHAHAEAVYNTTYWYVTPEEGDLRFVQTSDAFYLFSLVEPETGRLAVEAPVPALAGDVVASLGMEGVMELEWGIEDGIFWIDVTEDAIRADKFCWVFKVEYN